MADNENLSEEDKQAQQDADAYFKETHPEAAESENIYANLPIQESATSKNPDEAPAAVVGGGAATGAYGSYKGWGTKVLKPGEGVFNPVKVQPKAPATAPSYETRVEPEFNLGDESPLSHVDPYDTQVDEIMQSIRDKENPTGRQMERGHNWETNRESLATKGNLKTMPNAGEAIVHAGPMTPTRGGIAVPAHTAREIEEERIRKMAQERIAQEQAAQEAEQLKAERKIAEENAKVQSELKAEKTGKMLGIGKGIAKVGMGALGGGLAGKDFWDAYHEYKKHGWSDEAIAKTLQGAGGMLMVVPTPITEGLGAATIGAGMAYPSVAKHFHK